MSRSMFSLFGLRRSSRVERTAFALMISTGATALLGVAFWGVAAHLFSTRSVGRASAELAAMTFLAQFAQLNLANAFVRFLPRAGVRTRTVLLLGYGACTSLALLGVVAFLVSPLRRGVVPSGTGAALVFVGAVVLWTIFVVQDGALTGLRQAVWVPVENVAFGAVKLLLLPLMVAIAPTRGVFLAWTLPVIVVVAAVNAFLFLRVVPARMHAAESSVERRPLPPRRDLASFVAAQYAASIVSAAASYLPPVIIVKELGPVASAHFYVPWLVGLAFHNLLANISSAFIVEASHDEEPFRRVFWRSTRLIIIVTGVAMIVTIAAGSLLLGTLSGGYEREGESLLRWIAASFPFSAIVVVLTSKLWLQRRLWSLVGYQLLQTVVLIALTFAFLDERGIDAPGIANLAAVGLAAIIGLPFIVRWYRRRVSAPFDEAPVLTRASTTS